MITKPKGTKDLFGIEAKTHLHIINKFSEICNFYNFSYIETPIFEKLETFIKNIGESSDIVTKEMYVFKDKANRKLALRPENTASVIRAYGENKLFSDPYYDRLFYYGPMFRYERPQKGRYRQFNQLGLEALHERDALKDTEIILLALNFIKSLNIPNTKLLINTLGPINERNKYIRLLKDYFSNFKNQMDELNQMRIQENPLRILDDKKMAKLNFVINAPKIYDSLLTESHTYFENVQKTLDDFNVDYTIQKNLVRGLDYYSDIVFEIVTTDMTEDKRLTIVGGGRYNSIFKNMIGLEKSGIGFSFGIERLVELFDSNNLKEELNVFVGLMNEENRNEIFKLTEELRKNKIKSLCNTKPVKYKKINAFVKANKSTHVIFKEIKNDVWKIKNLLTKDNDEFDTKEELINFLKEKNENYK